MFIDSNFLLFCWVPAVINNKIGNNNFFSPPLQDVPKIFNSIHYINNLFVLLATWFVYFRSIIPWNRIKNLLEKAAKARVWVRFLNEFLLWSVFILRFVLKNIPKESIPSNHDPMIVSSRTVDSEPIPGIEV